MALAPGARVLLTIATCYDGVACEPGEQVHLEIRASEDELRVAVDAPYFADPPPAAPVGPTEQLYNHEVVELMLLGSGDRYLELELSPHGHYLVLELHGERHIVRQGMPMAYRAEVDGSRWRGEAHVPRTWLPPACERLNAYAMHGEGAERRYLAWRPPRGARPDFHRLTSFGAWPRDPSCDSPER
jgi:hypothetical protein